jgi:DNA-binding beta-propeller fold protein YncE
VAALGNDSLEIVGLRESRRVQSIPGMKKPTGVAYLPRLNCICVANSGDGTVRIYDAGTYQPKQIIPGLESADNVRYAPETDLIYVGYGKGGIALLDGSQGQVLGMIKLKGHPESFQLDLATQTLFVNVPDARQVAVLDLKKRDVMGSWPLEQFQANYPMALDTANHRLLIGCRRPARLLALDSQSGKVTSELTISADADDLFLDSKRHRLYVSAGEGFVDVIEQAGADQYRLLEKVPTAPGARTCYYTPELDVLAVAVPKRANQAAELRVYQPR